MQGSFTMPATARSLFRLTAADLMTRDVVVLSQETPLREAARLLFRSQVSGAPVVDAQGKCIGVLSAADFAKMASGPEDSPRPQAPAQPLTCSFLVKYRGLDGEQYLCSLPPGACSMQVLRHDPAGGPLTACGQPHAVPVDWQLVEVEKLPEDAVRRHMTADPVTAAPTTLLHDLAQMMTDAHVHRVIIVDDCRRPVGVVSSTDILAAVADAGRREELATVQDGGLGPGDGA
jgi:CBS-domain-containing membrane protein